MIILLFIAVLKGGSKITSIPKPTKSNKKGNATPQLTEDEIMEINEKFTGIIKSVQTDTKMILFDIGGLDQLKISANINVEVDKKERTASLF